MQHEYVLALAYMHDCLEQYAAQVMQDAADTVLLTRLMQAAEDLLNEAEYDNAMSAAGTDVECLWDEADDEDWAWDE